MAVTGELLTMVALPREEYHLYTQNRRIGGAHRRSVRVAEEKDKVAAAGIYSE
jgi:hypothetical protein